MKFHSDNSQESLRISGYGDGYVMVAEQRVEATFAIHAKSIFSLDPALVVQELDWSLLRCLHQSPPEILILGTGTTQSFPAPALYAELAAMRIGLEVMSTPAACRTYNILRSEGRDVAAVLLVPRTQAID